MSKPSQNSPLVKHLLNENRRLQEQVDQLKNELMGKPYAPDWAVYKHGYAAGRESVLIEIQQGKLSNETIRTAPCNES